MSHRRKRLKEPQISQKWMWIGKSKKRHLEQRWLLEGPGVDYFEGFQRKGYKTLDGLWRAWNFFHEFIQITAHRLPRRVIFYPRPKEKTKAQIKAEQFKAKFF